MVFVIKVEKHDVDEAFRLLRVAMQQSATDHATGSFFTVTFRPIIIIRIKINSSIQYQSNNKHLYLCW